MLFKIIEFEIIIYLVITQNLLNIVTKVKFMETSTLHEKAQCISWFTETKLYIQVQQSFRRHKSHLHGLPLHLGKKVYGEWRCATKVAD